MLLGFAYQILVQWSEVEHLIPLYQKDDMNTWIPDYIASQSPSVVEIHIFTNWCNEETFHLISPEEQFRNWRNVENILHFHVEPICLSVKNSILTMFIWKCSMLIHLSSNYPVWQKSLSYAESFLLIVNSACCNFYINLNFWFWYNVVDLCVQYLDHDFEIIFPKIVCLGCFIGSFSIQHSQTKGFIGI